MQEEAGAEERGSEPKRRSSLEHEHCDEHECSESRIEEAIALHIAEVERHRRRGKQEEIQRHAPPGFPR